MKGPGQKIVINFGTGSPEGNGGPSHFAHRSMSQWCDHHMRKKRVCRMQSDSSASCARFLESRSCDCGGPEYAVPHNYRSIDSFRHNGAMKTYSQMVKTDFMRHSGGSKKTAKASTNKTFFKRLKFCRA